MTVWEVFKKQVPCSLTPNGEWIAQNTHACTYAVWRHMHVAYAGYFIVCIVCWSTTRSLSWQAPYTQSTQNATDGCYPLLNSPHYQKIPRVLNNMATAYWIIKISLPCAAREQRALSLLLHRMPKSVHHIYWSRAVSQFWSRPWIISSYWSSQKTAAAFASRFTGNACAIKIPAASIVYIANKYYREI